MGDELVGSGRGNMVAKDDEGEKAKAKEELIKERCSKIRAAQPKKISC